MDISTLQLPQAAIERQTALFGPYKTDAARVKELAGGDPARKSADLLAASWQSAEALTDVAADV